MYNNLLTSHKDLMGRMAVASERQFSKRREPDQGLLSLGFPPPSEVTPSHLAKLRLFYIELLENIESNDFESSVLAHLDKSDDEAIRLMNDSDFGLTASIWTTDEDAAMRIAEQLETGTVFMNRCDYLDPELAWVGVKNSGRGCTLSKVGFEQLTRPKSFHFRRL